jgi:hypothetical protein
MGDKMDFESNMYVFKTTGFKNQFDLTELRKLTFVNSALVVNKVDGTSLSVEFADLVYFSWFDNDAYQETFTSGITLPESVSEVTVYLRAGEAVVRSTQLITGINVFDWQGQKLKQLCPASQEVNISLATYPSGLYLIQVVGETGIITKKIIKN